MAPNRASTVSLEVVIKSDSYLGLDEKHDISFEVVSASTLPVYEPHPDDLELDNEPTLFEQVSQCLVCLYEVLPCLCSYVSEYASCCMLEYH